MIAALVLTLGLSTAANAEVYRGEIQFFANTYGTAGFLPADGRILSISDNSGLFAVVGSNYGGDGKITFALPNVPPLKDANKGEEVRAYIAAEAGRLPITHAAKMQGETVLLPANNLIKKNPMLLRNDGSILDAESHVALFSIIGAQFGGDGYKTFALPKMTYKTLNGPDLVTYTVAEGMYPGEKLCTYNDEYISQIKFAPYSPYRLYSDIFPANGKLYPIRSYQVLFSLITTQFGGDGYNTFALPKLDTQLGEGMQTFICTAGIYPARPY